MIPVETIRHSLRARLRVVLAAVAFHFVGLVTGLALPVHDAQAQRTPAVGTFLVASRDLRGSGFAESIILIIQHDQNGTMGLIINQPTGTNAAELLPDIAGLGDYEGKLYIGGPVAASGVIMLVQSARTPASAEHVFGNVYTSGDPELLSQLIGSGTFETEVRLYAGHAGWMPGQLDAEIRRGSWFIVPARTDFIFSTQPRHIWQQLIDVNDRLIVDAVGGPHQKYAYNAMSPKIMPIRSGHFSSATP
jgi:putative transcriptional regulator